MHLTLRRYAVLALSIVGSATLLFSCSNDTKTTQYDYETLMTESSENRTITMMENGMLSYSFVTPLMEGYSLAANPYQEFRRGIDMTTYTQDSTNLVDATIRANYAIYYENQRLWEAKGNVIIIKNNRDKGDTTVKNQTEIYTQQLFWNATTKKIYSNVDTKILQPDGWHFGVGFDADEDLKNIHFRKYSSEMEFDMSQPTPEEIEAENKKNEEANSDDKDKSSKSGKQSGSTKAERGDKNNNKGGKEGKDNKPKSNTIRPTNPRGNGSSKPQATSPRSTSPTSAKSNRKEQSGNDRTNLPSAAVKRQTPPEQTKLQTQDFSLDMSTNNFDLNSDISTSKKSK